jgi:hypothetical protein
VRSGFCSPNLTSSPIVRLHHTGAGSPVAQAVPLQRIDGTLAAQLASSASLFSRLSLRGGGLPALKVQPQSRNGGFRVEASGAYSKEAFVSEAEASKLAQVRAQGSRVSIGVPNVEF